MPKLGPVSLRVLIQRLRKFGFDGPYKEGKHPYMVKGNLMVTIPNPHEKEISVDLLVRILRQAGISREAWDKK
ncbi:MAG: type II toxin-antitoxin system HicA family toxin [Candidatus Yonathbacteria bacterium]|nr:type II toxin-antitoxin system HicA family toxin [Candidatus Yonathbacteria bacterium]